MVDGEELRVPLVDRAGTAQVSLRGTILTYRRNLWIGKETVDIPIESISITQQKQFRGSFLIAAILSLPFGLVLGGIGVGVCFLVLGNVPDILLLICMCSGASVGGLLFLVYLIRFCMRQETVFICTNRIRWENRLEVIQRPKIHEAAGEMGQEREPSRASIHSRPSENHKLHLVALIITGLLTPPMFNIVGSWIFLGVLYVFIVGFFLRQRTEFLRIDWKHHKFRFWVDACQRREVDKLIEEIQHRKQRATAAVPLALGHSIGNDLQQPWKVSVIALPLFAIPALALERPQLLLLCVIPIVGHLVSCLVGMREPEPYRRAMRHYYRGEWEQARKAAKALLDITPDHKNGRLLLIDMLIRLEDADGAEQALAGLHGQLDRKTLESLWKSIQVRRIICARKKTPA